MMHKAIASLAAGLCVTMLLAGAALALNVGDPIVGNVFVTGFDGWTDTDPGNFSPLPNWGVLLTQENQKALMEGCNTIPTTGGSGAAKGQTDVFKMVNLAYSTPSEYTLTAKIGSWDDDGFGLVFGYQDENNYFWVGNRAQNSDSYGYPRGVSVQKVVGSVRTHLAQNTTIRTSIPCLGLTNAGTFFDLAVAVSGNTYTVSGNYTTTTPAPTMTMYLSGTDDDLPGMAAGHYGVHSWAQKQFSTSETGGYKDQGTIVQSVTVASDTFNKTHTFSDVIATNWRLLRMTNALGAGGGGGEDYGNFRQDFRNGTIIDDSNSYEWATTAAANVDFVGQGVVVDEPGNADWTDYRMTVRVTSGDDEGPGVLLRVQDDKTFYRVNFATQAMGTGATRAPQGMSIQKCVDGGAGSPIWTELYREPQGDGSEGNPGPKWLYSDDQPFDLEVCVVGRAITVHVVDDPNNTGTGRKVINYDTAYDLDSPLLSGSVGLTNWGAGDADNGLRFSAYGGQEGHPLLTYYIPEPSALVLLGVLSLCALGVRRRN